VSKSRGVQSNIGVRVLHTSRLQIALILVGTTPASRTKCILNQMFTEMSKISLCLNSVPYAELKGLRSVQMIDGLPGFCPDAIFDQSFQWDLQHPWFTAIRF
jgi:hypothetical protein